MDEDEILFLTSNERIYQAYLAWHKRYSPSTPLAAVKRSALESTRELLRTLKVPTADEVALYRQEV